MGCSSSKTNGKCPPLSRSLSDPVYGMSEDGLQMRYTDSALNDGDRRTVSSQRITTEDGLRLLLRPTISLPRSISASGRFGDCSKRFIKLSESSNGYGSPGSGTLDPPSLSEENSQSCITEVTGDAEVSGSPLFDPLILETFERAIEALSEDSEPNSDVSLAGSQRVSCSPLDECSDADSPSSPKRTTLALESSEFLVNNTDMDTNLHQRIEDLQSGFKGNVACGNKKGLEEFELRCPPGSEDKIVLYYTSLRGIRATYENCCLVRSILKGLRVQIDERDVWLHSDFREELANALGKMMPVPRLFIKGRHIGGAEDVKRLHEEGTLKELLNGLPDELNEECDACGGRLL